MFVTHILEKKVNSLNIQINKEQRNTHHKWTRNKKRFDRNGKIFNIPHHKKQKYTESFMTKKLVLELPLAVNNQKLGTIYGASVFMLDNRRVGLGSQRRGEIEVKSTIARVSAWSTFQAAAQGGKPTVAWVPSEQERHIEFGEAEQLEFTEQIPRGE